MAGKARTMRGRGRDRLLAEVGVATAKLVASDVLIDRGILTKGKDGLYQVDSAKLAALPRPTRMRMCLQVIEGLAAMGSLDAAKAALAHHRWAAEMSQGRAPIRGELVLRPPDLVDDLGTRHDGLPQQVVDSQEREDDKPRLVAKG